jgi:hypothetical protein
VLTDLEKFANGNSLVLVFALLIGAGFVDFEGQQQTSARRKLAIQLVDQILNKKTHPIKIKRGSGE